MRSTCVSPSRLLTSAERLAELGVILKQYRPGGHRAACPECKRGPRDTALAVTIDGTGDAVWLCHRCGWKGCARDTASVQHKPARPPRPKPQPLRPGPDPWGLWIDTLPVEPGTVAAVYLERRGCALPHSDGPVRWHPRLRHPSGHIGPALVALVRHAVTRQPLTIHRTWLAGDGSGKAEVDPPRMLWPGLPKLGGVIRLCPDAELTMGLAVAEGIETALTIAHVVPAVWATIDGGNLATLPPVPGIEALTIIADHDEVNPKTGKRPGQAAAEACAAAWTAAGVEVRIWTAPAEGQDLNDWVRAA